MKRPRPTPATPDTFNFSVSNGHAFRAERLADGSPTLSDSFDDTDSMSWVLHFRPALSEAQAAEAVLSVSYVGDKEVANPLVFSHAVRPSAAPHVWLALRQGELEYLCFETHQLRVGQVPGTFAALYVVIENVQCDAGPIQLSPQLDMHLVCLPTLLPTSTFLRWFPPDVDPKRWGLQIDARKIPQTCPLFWSLRAELTGSVAVKRTGFFPGDGASRSAFMKSAMRLGSLSEDVIMLLRFGDSQHTLHFTEVGTCPVAGHPGWGASPDGIICDDTMKWSSLPPTVSAHLIGTTLTAWNIHMGACEFKTSRTKLCMEGYFYPQLYMEMMALGVLWADLVRYRPSRTWNAKGGGAGGGEWEYQDVCHVYRIYREAALEERFIRIWSSTSTEPSDEKSALCAELNEMAKRERPTHIIDGTGNALLKRYRAHRDQLLSNTSTGTATTATQVLPAWWLSIESVTAQLAAQLKSGVALDKRLVAEQIRAYANLLVQRNP